MLQNERFKYFLQLKKFHLFAFFCFTFSQVLASIYLFPKKNKKGPLEEIAVPVFSCFFKVQNDGEVEMTLVLKKVKVKNKEKGFKKF